jgi:hypothetical protein
MHTYHKCAFDVISSLETKSVYDLSERALKEKGKEWLVASYKPEDFGVINPDDITWMNSRLCPMPWHTHDQPLRITNPKAKRLPKSYICCSEFGNALFKAQKSLGEWDYHELMKGHDVMITAPTELVRLLETLKDNGSNLIRKNQV